MLYLSGFEFWPHFNWDTMYSVLRLTERYQTRWNKSRNAS